MDVHDQPVRFVMAAAEKMRPFGALCAEYEISRPTGYLWLKPYRELGVNGIAEQSRKPHHSPRRTDAVLEQHVVRARRRYPDWGARGYGHTGADVILGGRRQSPAKTLKVKSVQPRSATCP
jgi:hypothetical protein